MKKEYLDESLWAYSESDFYPFHMPGHKRRKLDFYNPYKIDITEIEGFDNLHHAEGILLEAQDRLRNLYQSKKAYYLINGSTCGLLSAIGAVTKPGDSVILARNCHKAVYNAVKIFNLKAKYVYPEYLKCGLQGAISPEEVENALKSKNETKVVIITSPTYDGITSNIRKIAEITSKYNCYLIIDEAHGAHFSLSKDSLVSSVHQGADIVIQSLHKTLPSFTQTAVLHIASEKVDAFRVEEMLGIFQTSSPSYILMAGIERCVKIMTESGEKLFQQYFQKLNQFYKNIRKMQKLHVFTSNDYESTKIFEVDPSKIVISTRGTNLSGKQLYEILLEKYHLQMEMYSAQYVLAMTSIMDTQEGFDRLFRALIEIDERCIFEKENYILEDFIFHAYKIRKKRMEIGEAAQSEMEQVHLRDSIGRISREFVYLYPPGIPMIVPGEEIEEDFVEIVKKSMEAGLQVQGMRDVAKQNGVRIMTVKRE